MAKTNTHSEPNVKTHRVLIVDDHPAVREGLALRISRQDNLEVCGEAADVVEALHLVASTSPDIAVIDIMLQNGNGIDLIKRIKSRYDSVRMLVWSMYSESLYAERALRAGASGYINKEQATSQIIAAIQQVLEGKIYVSGPLGEQLLNRALGKGRAGLSESPVETLSDRELEVFQHLGRGLDTQQIAERMHVSPKTVETYRSRIKEKLELSGANELISRAVQWVLESR
jgi:DNA-binding NarL/FixJ family response regulator